MEENAFNNLILSMDQRPNDFVEYDLNNARGFLDKGFNDECELFIFKNCIVLHENLGEVSCDSSTIEFDKEQRKIMSKQLKKLKRILKESEKLEQEQEIKKSNQIY